MSDIRIIGELIQTKPMQYEWLIPDFSSVSSENADCCYSSLPFTLAGSRWKMYISRIFGQGSYLSVILDKGGFSGDVTCSLSIKQADGTLSGIFTLKGTSNFMFDDFINISAIRKRRSELLPQGVLTIVCIVNMSKQGKQKRRHAGNTGEENSLNKEKAISLAQKKLKGGPKRLRSEDVNEENTFNKSEEVSVIEQRKLNEIKSITEGHKSYSDSFEFFDVTLKVQGKVFKAHKAVLSARSPVFTLLFMNDIYQRCTGEIRIYDCDPLSFREFLNYIYSGKVEDISFQQAFELYKTADKYEFPNLKKICVEQMKNNLKADNVLNVIALADQYGETDLLNAGLNCVYENFAEIVQTSQLLKLMKQDRHLASGLLVRMVNDCTFTLKNDEASVKNET